MIIEWLVPEAFVARCYCCFLLLQISKISTTKNSAVKLRKFLKRFLHKTKIHKFVNGTIKWIDLFLNLMFTNLNSKPLKVSRLLNSISNGTKKSELIIKKSSKYFFFIYKSGFLYQLSRLMFSPFCSHRDDESTKNWFMVEVSGALFPYTRLELKLINGSSELRH